MHAGELTRALKVEAERLGFDLVGIAPATPPPHAERLAEWLAAGYAGEMAWLARNAARRIDPRQAVPGARSVIVCGVHYRAAEPDPALWNDPARGRISRYAWGDDYHDILLPKLRALQAWLEGRLGRAQIGRSYVDTGPVLERPLGALAGLGFQGKNTLLIHPRQGSWFFLGEILVDVELHYDAPQPIGGCGGCTRCLRACPTQAFAGPYVLDARRCISYLTIELKGPIPRELRPLLGNHIYGCDVCQEVCPWNQRWGRFSAWPEFRPDPERVAPRLLDLIRLDDEQFRARFRGSPIKRTKRRGLLRNVAVALGNWGDPLAVPALTTALNDHEPLIRGHAAWALGRIGGAAARRALETRYAGETDGWVRDEIALALAEA
ncbi:tRNA epoxyqueuosine(34) reductase QueG [Kallotenue papyrolyticum]|uniref:tRNA epoxyqueuosine(34) reductase QueG n=1 Tax=Kallotenue papyrolyticum TaxID=1325125 RepID=UPI0004720B85|nr:tRNA epoxyqueuosine(34) reductase QueG [Kallotenue papyrolyticum]